MDRKRANTLIISYLENQLSERERVAFEELLVSDTSFRDEVNRERKAWELLLECPMVEPNPAFESHFYARLVKETSGWGWRFIPRFRFVSCRWVPAMLGLLLLVSGLTLLILTPGEDLVRLPAGDYEIIQDYELMEHWDVIEDLELWLDLERMARAGYLPA
jgi:hypothetical protein